MLTPDYVRSVWQTMAEHVRPTVLVGSDALDAEVGVEVTLACEMFQHGGSFKYRAAYNLLSSVPHELIVTASSGNFGQAAALAAGQLGKACSVVMPNTSSRVKIDAVRRQGAIVELVDTATTSRMERVQELMEAHPAAFYASAFDDTRVVAGNSTLGREIVDGVPELDVIVAPVGGGGLISGIVTARDVLRSSVAVLGAEPALGNDAARSLQSGSLVANEAEPGTIADGARTLSLGSVTWPIVRGGVEDIVEVPEAAIAEAVRLLFRFANVKAEPTGALALAALLVRPERFVGWRVCCVVSGGNVDEEIYAAILRNEM
ncbi:MAG: pyridoxal-phosphate dependent enzyme [Chloroflexi bacterium]|nr:pyridoxal-phosphate dependent enzyme [Chloroflexota bacterium]